MSNNTTNYNKLSNMHDKKDTNMNGNMNGFYLFVLWSQPHDTFTLERNYKVNVVNNKRSMPC